MKINTYIFSKDKTEENILNLLNQEFNIGPGISLEIYNKYISRHLNTLKDDLYFLAETKYVDKVYRDTYYKYYSSKYDTLDRHCIRISVFEGEITTSLFESKAGYSSIEEKYLGFYVLRPTWPYVIGRSVISPKALKENSFICCMSSFSTTARGLQFKVNGFPHSSQDTETMTCAETSLWAIMEYFGNKYPEYNGSLPSKIINTLDEISIERQLPSSGLDINQMSYALKKFGFGSKIYSKEYFGEEFDRLLSCYVESGIPLIISMGNNKSGDDSIEHAVLVIGHKKITPSQIDSIKPYTLKDKDTSPNFIIYDYDRIEKDFIFVDDNCPVYQPASLSNPTVHYDEVEWQTLQINYFIAPLYPKIYLEATEAKRYIMYFISSTAEFLEDTEPTNPNIELDIRVFLASSRSYKATMALCEDLESRAKDYIIETPMPKFIWVAEISNRQLIQEDKADGLILLDATEGNYKFQKPLIFAFILGKMFKFDKELSKLSYILLNLKPFEIYKNNLKAEKINS